jgi:hypothetical protein
MSKIYLVNVGSNAAHSATARSPVFKGDSFCFVPFPCPDPRNEFVRNYPQACIPFVKIKNGVLTHDDPDWGNLTYGDNCANLRARALNQVEKGDILLFWGMLWNNTGNGWIGFRGGRGWYLLAAFRVAEFLSGGQVPDDAHHEDHAARAGQNVHFRNGKLRKNDRVFIADPGYSALFATAVDLGVANTQGLVYQAMRTARGLALCCNGRPRWYSSLRACRAMWNLDKPEHWQRVQLVRDAIQMANGYDLLRDIPHQ